jgi:hypothetical protein
MKFSALFGIFPSLLPYLPTVPPVLYLVSNRQRPVAVHIYTETSRCWHIQLLHLGVLWYKGPVRPVWSTE